MMHRPTPKTGVELAEHLEIDHERELAFCGSLNTREIKARHADMHRLHQRDDWDHYHGRKKAED